MKIIRAAVLAALAALPACAQQPPPATPPPSTAPAVPGQSVCTRPRPEACTREYRPVCGTRADGTRQTYGNGCSACGDANVLTYVPGPCG